MNTAHRLEFFTTDDGEPWACFAWGDVPPEIITRERILEAAEYYAGLEGDDLDLKELAVQAMWIQKQEDDSGPDFDELWRFCAEGDPGAEHITGVRFQ